MLALSAAMRAVAAEPELGSAVATLEREACRLLRAREATLIAIDRAGGTVWTLDGSVIGDEIRALVARVADTGERAVLGPAVFEPIGGPRARAVLAVRRRADERFAADDLALVSALAGGVAATLIRMLGGP